MREMEKRDRSVEGNIFSDYDSAKNRNRRKQNNKARKDREEAALLASMKTMRAEAEDVGEAFGFY
ncbi:hypothetical protein TSUD_341590 [Trifolium subterraneum]|uniref:Uncharacterized protein n=1 Tax=Trifolium subterraneum TaxID=3900 RepID=A0A2Z6NKN7_TRISU|nr:hypothetical protein TSUD_341590 [Trifolium subterraneum]